MALFNDTAQYSGFTQEPASINHVLFMAHQLCARWFTGKHQACHQNVRPALQQQCPCGAHRLTACRVDARSPVNQSLLDGGNSTGCYFQLSEGAPCSRAGWTTHALASCQGCYRTQPRSSIHRWCPCTPTQEELRVTMGLLLLPLLCFPRGVWGVWRHGREVMSLQHFSINR